MLIYLEKPLFDQNLSFNLQKLESCLNWEKWSKFYLRNISYLEGKSFVQHSSFFILVCQFQNQAKMHAKKVFHKFVANFPYNASSIVTFPKKVSVVIFWVFWKELLKNIKVTIDANLYLLKTFLVRITAFQGFLRNLEGRNYPAVSR